MPRIHPSTALFPLTLVLACGSTHSSVGTGHCTVAPPTSHRATAPTCSSTRPPSQPGDAGALLGDAGNVDAGDDGVDCQYDSQCTQGLNGRCTRQNDTPFCTYDECTTDASCGTGQICECGATEGDSRDPNLCLTSGCLVDSDCGSGGYCSPSYDTLCGPFDGIVGYFCHRAAAECTTDDCVNDSDCAVTSDGAISGPGYCAWDPNASKWSCFYGACAG